MQDKAVTAAQMKQLEQAADQAGLSYRQMMENAGHQAYRAICRHYDRPDSATIFAGKGNNGGDGFVVARLLAADGVPVRVVLCEGTPVTEDAQFNLSLLGGVEIWLLDKLGVGTEAEILDGGLIVDALYGTGFHGALRPDGRHAADLMNQASGPVCALDLPSGLEADTGRIAEGAVQADLTICFHARKRGMEQPGAAALCGQIEVADIGITDVLAQA